LTGFVASGIPVATCEKASRVKKRRARSSVARLVNPELLEKSQRSLLARMYGCQVRHSRGLLLRKVVSV
jgi:hypothetical protein